MTELEKIAKETSEKLGVSFDFYPENTKPKSGPVCDKQFEGVTDDGSYTFFRFTFRNTGYIGALLGVSQTEKNYAELLPAYLESFTERESELSKTEYLKRILLGECSSLGVYKYAAKYSVRGWGCFVIVLRVPKYMQETLALLEQYGGNSLDTAVQMSEDHCALVKFIDPFLRGLCRIFGAIAQRRIGRNGDGGRWVDRSRAQRCRPFVRPRGKCASVCGFV